MATLKVTPRFFNSYEAAYDILSKRPDFNQYDWERNVREGDLDQYITTLVNFEYKITDRDKFNKEYYHEYADDTTRQADMYNELYADRTNVDEVRERYAKDDNGSILMKDGKPIIEKYTASDYEYYKSILAERNYANYQKYLQQQEQERKDSMNGFVKFIATIPATLGETVVGVANMVDNVLNSLIAAGKGSVVSKGENIADTIVQTNVSDAGRIFEKLGLQDFIIDLERKYSYMRNVDGTYTNVGKVLGGVATSLGEMLPAMLAGGGAGKAAIAAGKSAKTIATVQRATSSLVFYTGMTSGNVREMYDQMASEGVSVPSAAILANASIKSALQWGVEVGLGKLMGGASTIDSMVFGRTVKSGTTSTLTKAGLKRLAADFTQEGLEEAVQDTSDFLVDRAFMLLIDENFGKMTSLSWQSLMDAYIIGGIASISGSALNIATTKRVVSPEFKTDKDNNIIYDRKTGGPKFKKLNKIASWEYGLDMQSFISNYNTLQQLGNTVNQQFDANSREGKRFKAAFGEMYASFRMLSSIYSEIGDERFKAANDLLTEITNKINSGKFDAETLKTASTQVMEHFQGMEVDALKIALDKLEKAGITEIATAVERGDDTASLPIDDETKKKIDEAFAADPKLNKVLLTNDGNNIVIASNILFVPINYAKNVDGKLIFDTVAEQTLVENVANGKYKGLVLKTVTDTFRQVSGREDVDTEEAVFNLLFNESFFRIVLSTANKDMFKFVTSLNRIESNVITTTLRETLYQKKIRTVLDSMKLSLYDYITNNAYGNVLVQDVHDLFSDEEVRKIRAAVWCKNLCARVISDTKFKKLTKNDWTVLESRVNAMPVAAEEKTRILENLHSSKSDVRAGAMNRIALVYSNVFTSKYDGKTYMPDNSLPCRTFNAFLQKNGFVLDTLISTDVDENTKKTIAELYVEFNQENLIKFRQSQFERDCGGNYTFMYDKEGRIGVYEADSHKQVGFSKYSAQIASVISPDVLDNRTVITAGGTYNYLVRTLLNKSIDKATAAYLSIDDVITDPSLLDEEIQAKIKLDPQYGEVTPETTFLYLRRHFLDDLKTTTIVVMGDGTYGFANVRPMKSSLLSDKIEITKTAKLSQFIKSQYLYGRLEDTIVKLTNRNILAEYNNGENCIYINSKVAQEGGDLLTFAFLHEFQHAIQMENGMNLGIAENWINSKGLDKKVRKSIIEDVRKHRPELFKDIAKGSKEEAKIVNDFVYYSCGESTAMGIDASKLLDFYPTVVSTRNNVTTIHLSWGNVYNISQNCPFSLTAQGSIFDRRLSREEIERYRGLARKLDNELKSLRIYEGDIKTIEDYRTSFDYGQLNVKRINEEPELSKLVNSIIDDVDSAYQFMEDFLSAIDDNDFLRNLQYIFVELINSSQDAGFSQYFVEFNDIQKLIVCRYFDLFALSNGFLKADQYKVKQFTSGELRALFDKYSDTLHIQKVGKKVFDLFERFTTEHSVNIRFIDYMDKLHGQYVMGSSYGDLLRYNSKLVGISSSRKLSVNTLLHEVIHYITTSLQYSYSHYNADIEIPSNLINTLNAIETLYIEIKTFASKYSLEANPYAFKTVREFMAEWGNDEFMAYLDTLSNAHSRLPEDISTLIYAMGGSHVDDFRSAYEFLMNTLFDYISGPGFNVFGKLFEAYLENRRQTARYYYNIFPDTHNGRVENVFIDQYGQVYRFDDATGHIIYSDESDFMRTSLGDSDSDVQSLTSSKIDYDTVRDILSNEVDNMRTQNEDISAKQVIANLRDDFPYVPEDIIERVVNEVFTEDTVAETTDVKTSQNDTAILKNIEFTANRLFESNKDISVTELIDELKKQYSFVSVEQLKQGAADVIKSIESKKDKKEKAKKTKKRTVTETTDIDTLNEDDFITEEEALEKTAKRMLYNNKKLTSAELSSVLQRAFPSTKKDKIMQTVNTVMGISRLELEKLNEEVKGQVEKTDTQNSQNRTQHVVSDEYDVIVNTTGHGKWIEKRPRLDKDGRVRRTKDNSIIYDYVYPTKKRSVSQKAAKGTNLEKYGYVKKYKRTQMSQELQHFINNATEDIGEELWTKLTSGKLTTADVMDYFRDIDNIESMNQKTFALINDSFFHNNKIKTPKQLNEFVEHTAEYYAARAIARRLGYESILVTNTKPNLLEKFVSIIENDIKLKPIYDSIVSRYYTSDKNAESINKKNLRKLWMTYFDGSFIMGGYIATIAKVAAVAKWQITGEGHSKARISFDAPIGENKDMTLDDVLNIKDVKNDLDNIINSHTRDDLIFEILEVWMSKEFTKPEYKTKSPLALLHESSAYRTILEDMSKEEFEKEYAKIVKGMSQSELDRLFVKALISETANIEISKLNDDELKKLNSTVNTLAGQNARSSQAIISNAKHIVSTIKSNLSPNDKVRFLKENGDIFNDDLTFKEEKIHKKDSKGRIRLLDEKELRPLEERVQKLSKDVRNNVYKSQQALNYKRTMERQIKQLQNENAKLVEKIISGENSKTVVTYEVSNEEIVVDTTRELPYTLKRLLATDFNKVARSKTQYLIEGDKFHIQTNLNKFLSDNAELLNVLTQADVDELVDFYLHSEIIPSSNKARQYTATQVYLMTYLLAGSKKGKFVLTDEQYTALNDRLETIVSISSTNLNNWRAARKLLKPEEVIIQSLAKSCGIEFATTDVVNLIKAIDSGRIEKIQAAKTAMYENGLKSWKDRKTSYLDKLLKFERMAMLSGPGTWVRNQVSNAMVTAGNRASEQVGSAVSKLIEKMFPKKKWRRDNQYVLIGTKVSSETKKFIDEQIDKAGLFELVHDGLTKYDGRKDKDDTSSDDTLTKMVIASIKAKIFQESTFSNKHINKIQNFILKQLSDDSWIKMATKRYLGKTLTEDKIDLSQGLTKEVLDNFSEAYKLAAYDYMHKKNFFNKIETKMREELGEAAFFTYKQILPFASASWNWFIEGLNYTPIGLVKAIRNFAKLENTIDKLETRRQHGEATISSHFAEYIARRNIGKGIIGTIGTAIGVALAALGFAGIDEEDKKYKLFIQMGDDKVTVDISDIFGTQGILLGITAATAIRDGDWFSAVGDTLDTMFLDSTFADLFNSFRYNDGFGDWLSKQPFSVLQMFIPNFFKVLASTVNKYKIKYSSGILGKIEQLAVNTIPGLAYAFPKRIDPYTGENQVTYKFWFATNLVNRLTPLKIYPYNVSDAEKEAISLGLKKGPLSGRYEVDGQDAALTSKQNEKANEYYGKLNQKDLEALMSGRDTYKVWDAKTNQYVELRYKSMNEAQKKTVIERIMSNNSHIAKIYILTSSGDWKYYANDSEYATLKKLGIKNVYKKTNKLEGFVKN